MAANETANYVLGAGVFASSRLDVQYSVIVHTLGGNLLDPCIPNDTPDLKIADVCCGTGYFLINLDTDPSAELHAFDIDLSRLPPEPWLPGVKRHVWNVYEPPPTDLASTFDIINCQLLFLFIPDEQVDKVFSNILSLLKPGGHIQWMEASFIDAETISPDPTYTPQYLPLLRDTGVSVAGRVFPSWPRDLDKVFERHGIEVVNVDRKGLQPRHYKTWTLQFLAAQEEIKPYQQKRMAGGDEVAKKQIEEYSKLVEKWYWEAHVKNCAYVLPFIRVVGRKPEGVQRA